MTLLVQVSQQIDVSMHGFPALVPEMQLLYDRAGISAPPPTTARSGASIYSVSNMLNWFCPLYDPLFASPRRLARGKTALPQRSLPLYERMSCRAFVCNTLTFPLVLGHLPRLLTLWLTTPQRKPLQSRARRWSLAWEHPIVAAALQSLD